MKHVVILASLALVSAPVFAAKKPCEALKAEIASKIEAHGVKHFSLEIVPKDAAVTGGKVVGRCDGGAKKIVYRRG